MRTAILLVEDDPGDQKLILMALGNHGLAKDIVVANDGQEALDFLFGTGAHAGRDPDDMPTVILLDLHLPRVDGLEVLRRIRANERTRLQPVVILTSSDEEKDRLACYGLGANSYVRKLVDFNEFEAAVSQLRRYWLLVNVPPRRQPTSTGAGG